MFILLIPIKFVAFLIESQTNEFCEIPKRHIFVANFLPSISFSFAKFSKTDVAVAVAVAVVVG